MDKNFKVYVVDDDATTRALLENVLSAHYDVETFGSGEACMERAEKASPNLFLLDVGLPGIDGYGICKMIRETPGWEDIPVIFLSGHDKPEDAWAGYDAGGYDYLVKPFEAGELQRKIEVLHHIKDEKTILQNQLKLTDELASAVMTNLDEFGVLINFLRKLNECTGHADLINAIMDLHRLLHLEPVIQVRMRDFTRTYSKNGTNWPLEVSLINNVRDLDRVFTFKNRVAFNFDHVTIIIMNMPVENPDFCGRVRDNIAIAAECAEAKIIALQNDFDKSKMRDELHGLIQKIDQTVGNYSKGYDDARLKGSLLTQRLADDLLASLAHAGLTEAQEEEIINSVKSKAYELVELYDIAGETQTTLSHLGDKIEQLITSTDAAQAGNA